ncbi:MAG: GAF domain-containing protein [Chloroflexi bacterium]|uniref:GAF domain-containing protein n=1 Tax=Candidatus Chlorohelix allophototropha TaxID=3003348 RepID=A0A8T7LSL5_9CHLR|nr:GAF domain-containing protein [Chloroflexota bacterium]WJW66895.1 GAF domain-containing sensor histidine kinase [Chloroflexota bacterium L227-S17]
MQTTTSAPSLVQDTRAVDLINQSRKLMSQRTLDIDNLFGIRLSYARWLLILALGIYYFLGQSLNGGILTFTNPALLLTGGYIVFNMVVWLLTLSFSKQASLLIKVSLVFDLIFVCMISHFLQASIYSFAVIPVFLTLLLVGLSPAIFSIIVVVVVNFTDLYLTNFGVANTKDIMLLEFYSISGALLLLLVCYYIITQTPEALIRISNTMVEDALARAGESHLLDMQNRTRAVYHVANTLSGTLDYQEVIKAILHEMESVFDMHCGAVLLFDSSLNNVKVVDSLRFSPEESHRSILLQKGLFKDALNGGQPRLLVVPTELEEIRAFFPSLRNCQTTMLIPLRAGMEVFGLLLIASKNENAYNTSDTELMISMGAHTVLAMQNATLYHNLLEDRNKLLTQEEEVRHELARNLHDGPAQAVAAISMQTEFIRKLFRTEPDRALEELANLGKQALQTSREIRTLLYELRPLVLETQGLIPALGQYAKRFPHNPSDPTAHFSTANFDLRLAPQVETMVFTIIQEAVNNARKHARARNIWIHLETRDGFIIAMAQDDGRGFDVSQVERNYEQRGSLGLTNMRERAGFVGGQVDIHSVIGQGTAVIMRIPINENTVLQPGSTVSQETF